MTADTLSFQPLRGATRHWRPFAAFGAIFLVWLAASQFGWVDPRFLPSPAAVAARARTEFTTGTLAFDIGASLRRNLIGFAIGASAGLLLGLVLGFSHTAERIVGPTLLAFRQIALFAWVPLLSVWFGGADAGKIAFIAVAGFQPVVINTWQGVRGLPPPYRELSDVLIFSRIDFAHLIALPGALPAIFTGLHAGLIYAWLATLGSELFLNVTPGIGGRLNEGSQLFEMDLLFLGIIILAAIGLFYNSSALWLETWLLRRRTR
ncbi:ABC transporter permease [Rhizobium rhizogenes]|uniref:Sulfate ester ABC transporter permease protein n=1 Tax=Rhizobium rhizogenes NBRC 13257 TaxID=1220581 RepID=A0AA87QEB8_RHIRH|nr:ABC transporter permease [Rhizobium rhizogenes]NTF59611.1 ABC transporter permease [Rhizobium rhizogenes]NTF65905.1 ABC transporter permease [Rhizobium rhizogenes]NTF79171.1 ABC transporter permease [Rhizobium rhizogenes]NTG04822.1 ABC transporter permease [Rhizobium rhizogenes]NTG25235.1 ABC transporter permease [Rhizobium rhizogenes]